MKLALWVVGYLAMTSIYFGLMAGSKPNRISWRDGWPFASVVAITWPMCILCTILDLAGSHWLFRTYNDAASWTAIRIRRMYK